MLPVMDKTMMNDPGALAFSRRGQLNEQIVPNGTVLI